MQLLPASCSLVTLLSAIIRGGQPRCCVLLHIHGEMTEASLQLAARRETPPLALTIAGA